MKTNQPVLIAIFLLQLLFAAPTLAQASAPEALPSILKCSYDLGRGVNILATSKFAAQKLVGVELQFNDRGGANLRLTPEKIQLFSLRNNEKLRPSVVGIKRNDQLTLVQFVFPSLRAESLAVVLLEGAVKSGEEDIGIKTNFGIRQSISMNEQPNSQDTPPCQKGLENWMPKDFLASRLMSKDKGIGLEAAIELIGDVDTADPGNLLAASYWINTANNPKLAATTFYKAMYRLRFGMASTNNMALPYVLGAVAPDVADYVIRNTPLLIQTLQETIEWDEKTFLQWSTAMGIDPKDARLQKNREVAKALTQDLILTVKKDPKGAEQRVQKYSYP